MKSYAKARNPIQKTLPKFFATLHLFAVRLWCNSVHTLMKVPAWK